MTWLTTISGKNINLRAISPELITAEDIAYSLSNIPRFTGHALRQISVAEHSLMVCDILKKHFACTDPAVLLAGLMHDAHEYLTGDVSRPMKQLLGDTWKAEEHRVQRAVLRKFGLLTAFTVHKIWIKQADDMALSAEALQLMTSTDDWPCHVTSPAPDWVRYGSASQFTPQDWQEMFLFKFRELSAQLRQAVDAIPPHQPQENA